MQHRFKMITIFFLSIFLPLLSSCDSKVSELRLQGIDFLEKGRYEEAIEAFTGALSESRGKVSSEQFDILCYRAEAEYMLGEYDKAADTVGILIRLDGEKDAYLKLKGQIEAKFLVRDAANALDNGMIEEAGMKLEAARAAGLENDRDLEFNRGVYYEKTARWEEAFDVFSAYVSRYPDDKEAEREFRFLKTRCDALKENPLLSGSGG